MITICSKELHCPACGHKGFIDEDVQAYPDMHGEYQECTHEIFVCSNKKCHMYDEAVEPDDYYIFDTLEDYE